MEPSNSQLPVRFAAWLTGGTVVVTPVGDDTEQPDKATDVAAKHTEFSKMRLMNMYLTLSAAFYLVTRKSTNSPTQEKGQPFG